MTRTDLPPWLTPSDVVRVLGVSRQAIHKRIESGRMRTRRIPQGKRFRRIIHRDDVVRWWQERRYSVHLRRW